MGLKIIDKMKQFVQGHAEAGDRALNRMAVDIERLSKIRVPVDKGQLKASGWHRKYGKFNYKVVFNKEYAAYQEFGGDSKRTIKRYTTPGTGKFYLRRSGDEIKKNAGEYFKVEVSRIHI